MNGGQIEIPIELGGKFLSAGFANIITCLGNCGYSLNESGCKFLECIFE